MLWVTYSARVAASWFVDVCREIVEKAVATIDAGNKIRKKGLVSLTSFKTTWRYNIRKERLIVLAVWRFPILGHLCVIEEWAYRRKETKCAWGKENFQRSANCIAFIKEVHTSGGMISFECC